jgi:HNH endonuclease
MAAVHFWMEMSDRSFQLGHQVRDQSYGRCHVSSCVKLDTFLSGARLKMDSNKDRCFSCLKTHGLSEEHIIPQCIGGRLKARLYCEECNKMFGSTLDKEIAENFGYIGTLLKISRERGSTQAFEVKETNTNTELYFDGKEFRRKRPIVNRVFSADGKSLDSVDVAACSEKELHNIMNSLKTKYQLSGNECLFEEQRLGSIDTNYTKTLDNELIRRAVTKIAYSFLCDKIPSKKVFSEAFDETRAYIRGGIGRDLACANFIHTRFMCDYVRPLHKIDIGFNRRNSLVVGYVMIFGIFRFTILLSNCYVSTHGSLIFRAVCEHRDRALCRWLPGNRGA